MHAWIHWTDSIACRTSLRAPRLRPATITCWCFVGFRAGVRMQRLETELAWPRFTVTTMMSDASAVRWGVRMGQVETSSPTTLIVLKLLITWSCASSFPRYRSPCPTGNKYEELVKLAGEQWSVTVTRRRQCSLKKLRQGEASHAASAFRNINYSYAQHCSIHHPWFWYYLCFINRIFFYQLIMFF